jgi:hypothetical protein
MGKKMQGEKITPHAIPKVKQGDFYIPDCPDYEPRINIPTKVGMDEVLIGWHCRNCKNLEVS